MNGLLLSLLVLTLTASVGAQTDLNFLGYNDTCQITGFQGTGLFVSKTFNFTNGQDKVLGFIFDDTAAAGRANDAVVCEVGYQVGTPIKSLSGVYDTLWSNFIALDTCNTTTASKRYDPSKYGGAPVWTPNAQDAPVRPHGQIDTTIGTTSSGMWIGFTPYWSPFCRFYVHGLSGNRAVTYVKARFILVQRAYVYVRQK